MRAGADRREQKKQAALHERELLTKMRGGKELTTEELAREKAAEERADKVAATSTSASLCPASYRTREAAPAHAQPCTSRGVLWVCNHRNLSPTLKELLRCMQGCVGCGVGEGGL